MKKPLTHTHCHLICCVYIKGACQYTLFDVRGVEIHSIHTIQCMCEMLYQSKDQSNVCMSTYKMVLSKMCLYVLFPSLMSLTYIALQPLGAFDLSLTSSTCFNIHSMDGWYGWKALSLSFPKLICGLKISSKLFAD